MHPIKILEKEHDKILENIGMLEKSISNVRKGKSFSDIKTEMPKLKKAVHVFEEAELHHKREEDVLFPMLEKKGIDGPPSMMRMEHEELRKRKKGLKNAVMNAEKMNYDEFASSVEENGNFIVSVLREHINKENTILYPMSMEVIGDDEWKDVRKRFDKIGYCCFSPIRTH